MSYRGILIAFCLGLALGLGGPLLASRYLSPYLPAFMQKVIHPIEGTVTHKQRDPDQILMTLSTSEGTILATFREKIMEIDLLIAEGDTVTVNLRQYEPFVNNPAVVRVVKQKEVLPSFQSEQGLSAVQSNGLQEAESIPSRESLLPEPQEK